MNRVLARLARPTVQAEAVRAAAGVAQFVLLARMLGASGFGLLALVALSVALLQPLLTPRLGLVLVRAAAGGAPQQRLVRAHVRACLRAVVLAGPVALLLAVSGAVDLPLGVLWLLFWSELGCLGVLGGLAAVAQGRQEFRRYRNLVVLAAGVRLLPAAVLLLVPAPGVGHWAAALALTATPATAVALWRRGAAVRPKQDDASADGRSDDVWVFSLNTLAVRLFDDADKALVAAFAGYAAAGVYTAAYRTASYVLVPVRAVLAEFAPALFRTADDAARWDSARSAVGRVLLVAAGTAPPLCLAALLAPWALGPGYADVSGYAVVLVPVLALRGVQYVLGDLLTATGRVRQRLAAQGVCLLAPLSACLLLVPPLGVWGAVAASALGEVLAVVLLLRWARRQARPQPRAAAVAGLAGAAA